MEKLIELVREYPILYDTSHTDYMKTKMKDVAWNFIAKRLNLTTQGAKSKWKALRHCHRDALRRRKTRNRQVAEPKKFWAYEKQMEFLLPYMSRRSTFLYITTDSEKKDDEEVDETINKVESEIQVKRMLGSEMNENNEGTIINRPKRMEKTNYNLDLLVKRVVHNQEKRCKKRHLIEQEIIGKILRLKKEEDDALYKFFLSMYSCTKELPQHLQCQVKKMVFAVVSNAEEQTVKNSNI